MAHDPGKLAWLEWNTARIQVAERFGVEFFGWQRRPMHLHPWGHMSLLSNGRGDHASTFMAMGHFAPAQWLLWISADIDAARERIEGLGGRLTGDDETVPGWGRNQPIEDPAGNRVTLHRREGGDIEDPARPGDPLCAELWADQAEPLARFYAALLGLDFTTTERGFTLSSGGVPRLLVRTNPYHPPPNRWLPYFRTASVGADVRRAILHGAVPYGGVEPIAGLGKLALFSDPTGAIFGLLEVES